MMAFIEHLGRTFSPEHYLVLTRIQGTLWTAADFLIVYALLALGNIVRAYWRHPPHRATFALLAATVPFALLLPIAPTPPAIFRLELLVTIPHFLLILYTCVTDTPRAYACIRDVIKEREARLPETKAPTSEP